jgi:hypothetical protein
MFSSLEEKEKRNGALQHVLRTCYKIQSLKAILSYAFRLL